MWSEIWIFKETFPCIYRVRREPKFGYSWKHSLVYRVKDESPDLDIHGNQCCGSGSVLDTYSEALGMRTRIQITDPDLDPDM